MTPVDPQPGNASPALSRRGLLRGLGAAGLTVAAGAAIGEARAASAGASDATTAPATTQQLYPVLVNPFSNAWGRPLGSTTVAPTSPQAVAALVEGVTVGSETDPEFTFGLDYLPLFVVASDHPLIGVSGSVGNTHGLIPIPNIARSFAPSTRSGDSPMVIVQPQTGKVWELFQAVYNGAWSVANAGVLVGNPSGGNEFLAGSNGVFPGGYGLAASGISYAGTMITQADVRSGTIRHTLALTLSNQESTQYWPPADRADGNTASVGGQLAEGMWFQMPASEPMPSGLTPFAQMVFRALQTYGAVVTDRANGTYLRCESPATWKANNQGGTDPITLACQGVPEYEVVTKIPLGAMQQIVPPVLGPVRQAPPGAPANLRATPGKGSLTLTWTAPSSPTAIRFYVLRGRYHGDSDWVILSPNPSGSGVPIGGLQSGVSYDFQVAAVSSNAATSTGTMGAASAIVTAAPY